MTEKKVADTLDRIEVFDEAYRENTPANEVRDFGEIHCSREGGPRRVDAKLLYRGTNARLAHLTCTQCDAVWLLLRYEVPHAGEKPFPRTPTEEQEKENFRWWLQWQRLIVVPYVEIGLASPNTPEGVAYYLDQAFRSRNTGANSAALAMYRAAVDQMLLDHGFKERMLGQKLAALEKAIEAGTAPKWAKDLDRDYLEILKQLGDGAIHPGASVKELASIDADTLALVSQVIAGLLDHIYEDEKRAADRKAALKAAVAKVKK